MSKFGESFENEAGEVSLTAVISQFRGETAFIVRHAIDCNTIAFFSLLQVLDEAESRNSDNRTEERHTSAGHCGR